ncbi:tetratricopeptide repeat protein [Planctomycetota bacterium]
MVNISNVYAKAMQAIEKRSFEYAIEMLIQCITLDPDNLDVRQKLRSTARHMSKESGSGASKKLKSGFGKLRGIWSSKVKKDPEKAMVELEKSLVGDPNSVSLLGDLGAAAIKADHIETAVWIFEDANRIDGKNISILENLTLALEMKGEIKAAQEACQKILDVAPSNAKARRKIKDLAAKETIDRAHLETAGSFRDSLKSEQAQDDFEVQGRILRTDEEVEQAIEMTKRQLAEEPKSTRLMLKLGDLHKRLSRWDDAQAMYDKAFAVDQADFTIKHKQGELQIDRLAKTVEAAKAEYTADKANTAAKQKYAELYKQLQSLKLEEFTKRVKAQPTNGAYHFDLGELLFQLKKPRESISEFQKVAHDPQFKLKALNYLGQCFTSLKDFELAEKQFLGGLESVRIVSDRYKPLIYNLGKLYIDMDRAQDAMLQLNRIYEVDINFKDVADLLQKLKSQ